LVQEIVYNGNKIEIIKEKIIKRIIFAFFKIKSQNKKLEKIVHIYIIYIYIIYIYI